MKRSLPLCLLGGCLWIGPEAHQARTEPPPIGASLRSVTPEWWSACVSDAPSFTVTVEVAGDQAGKVLDGWVEVDGGPRVAVDVSSATAAGADTATVELVLDGSTGLADVPCAGLCRVPVQVGLSADGAAEVIDLEVTLVADVAPALGQALAVGPQGTSAELATAPTQGSPPASLSVADWPTVGFTLVDPHLEIGLGGEPYVVACPAGTDPALAAVDGGPCTRLATGPDPALDTSGAHAFVADTAALGPLGCAAAFAGTTIDLHAVVLNHTCGGPYTMPLAEGTPLFVSADCDADNATWPDDCDDLDPTRSPAVTETWYDDVDSDCSGGSDFDQDGDGVDTDVYGGADCDDADAGVFPGAAEICDGKDDDCDHVLLVDHATVTSGGVSTNFETLQEALDAALDDDTVTLCDGRYDGPFTVTTDVHLTCGSDLEGACTLAGGSAGTSVLTVGLPGDALDVDVARVTITGGVGAPQGGGIDGRNAAVLDLDTVVLAANQADFGGGLAAGAQTDLVSVVIRDNDATVGGGGLVLADGAVLDFDDTMVTTNDAPDGGGLYATGTATLTGSGTFDANTATTDGGAIALRAGTASTVWEITGLTFSGQVTADLGGAIDAEGDGATLALDDLTFEGNLTSLEGGAIAVRSTGAPFVLTIAGSTFDGNFSDFGGALAAHGAEVTVSSSCWTGNEADDSGGAIAVADGSMLDTTDADFSGNVAELGGAVYIDASDIDLTDGTLFTNSASVDGGALFLLGGSTVFLHGAIQVDGNLAAGIAQGAYVEDQQLVACVGAQVLDPMANGAGAFTPVQPDCFEVTPMGFDAVMCNGC